MTGSASARSLALIPHKSYGCIPLWLCENNHKFMANIRHTFCHNSCNNMSRVTWPRVTLVMNVSTQDLASVSTFYVSSEQPPCSSLAAEQQPPAGHNHKNVKTEDFSPGHSGGLFSGDPMPEFLTISSTVSPQPPSWIKQSTHLNF